VPTHKSDFLTLVLDQGTSSTKIFLFNNYNRIVFSRRFKHTLHNPELYHVEADALNIAIACKKLINIALTYSKVTGLQIVSAGLALQRSTFLFWHKKSGKPASPALSWQDGRAHKVIKELAAQKEFVFSKTGTPLNSHFGGPKFLHLLRKSPSLQKGINDGSLWFGPLSAYLIQYLTGTARLDHSIASRSLMVDLNSSVYDHELLNIFSTPESCLPPLVSSIHNYGFLNIGSSKIPVKCVIGDQQAALIGHGGWERNHIALNLGTSASVQINAGELPLHIPGLISSVLFSDSKQKHFLIEGTINSCNSIFYWLEKELKIEHKKMLWDQRCLNTTTEKIIIPGFAGVAAPYWVDEIPPDLDAFNKDVPVNEIIRGAMESIGFLIYDIWALAQKHIPLKPLIVRAGGGGARDPLLQFIADLCRFKVGRTEIQDSTALGVHYLLLKAEGYKFPKLPQNYNKIFSPLMEPSIKNQKLLSWSRALKAAGIKDKNH